MAVDPDIVHPFCGTNRTIAPGMAKEGLNRQDACETAAGFDQKQFCGVPLA